MLLLDTNVVSYLLKGDTRAVDYAPFLEGNRLAISFMIVAELFEWAAVRRWRQPRLMQLEQALANYVVIPTDIALCRSWGRLRAQQRFAGATIASQDAWIAATAPHHSLPLVTHNPGHSQHIDGLDVRSILLP